MKSLVTSIFVFTIILCVSLFAEPRPVNGSSLTSPANGGLDTAFNAGVTDGSSTSLVSRPLPDGKILVGGNFTFANGVEKPFFARLNANGSLDGSFNALGTGPNGSVYDIVPLPSGSFLIGGSFTTYNGVAKSGIARLNTDGSLDTTFNSGGTGVTGLVQTIALQPDGKILISSSFSAYNGTPRIAVARLNPDGTLDTTFTSPFTTSSFVEEVDVLADGKILIGGVFNLNGRVDLMRLNPNGTADTTFNVSGSGTNEFGLRGVYAMQVQADGKILIGGGFESYNGVPRARGARVNADGSLDGSFVPPPIEGNGVEYIDILPDGKILAAGGFLDEFGAYALVRLNSDGSPDPTFADVVTDASGYHVTRQADGKILLTGLFNRINGQPRRNIVRLNADGTVDASFNAVFGVLGQVFDIALQPDGKTVVVGNFNLANGVSRSNLARFNADGSLDTTFNSGLGNFPDLVSAANFINTVAIQPDGKILIGGTFGGYNEIPRRGMARLNADGTLDLSFNAGFDETVPFVNINHILVLPDGKLMFGGNISASSSLPAQILGRLNANGTRDTSFLNGNGNGNIQRIARQPDGKIIAVGNFNQYAGQTRSRIIRVNTDSTLDPTFNIGTGTNTTIFNLALQPDGKILIGGAFVTYNGTARNRIARINANGSLDASFNPGTGANSDVLTFALQNDSKIIIGGFFSSYNGVSTNRLARLNADGSLDSSFVSGFNSDPRGFVRRILLLPDTKLLVSGTFKTYGGVAQNSLARVVTTTPPTNEKTRFDFDGDGIADLSVYRPSEGNWYLLRSQAGFNITSWGLANDIVTPGDFDGDGKADFAVFRPSEGNWYIANSNGTFTSGQFGLPGDIPVPADYDGDGKDDRAVFRPSNSTWYILNSNGLNVRTQAFGLSGDRPVPGDYDGDLKADLSVFRPSNGTWYRANSGNGNFVEQQWGLNGDIPVNADYDGDNKQDYAVFRPSAASWYILNSSNGSYNFRSFGLNGDVPVPGDYDGNGSDDIAVFRNGFWYIIRSDQVYTETQFGLPGDKAIPAK